MKTRLNNSTRQFLFARAAEMLPPTDEDAAENDAYAAAAEHVTACVEAVLPPKDMRVLTKYQVAAPDQCIRGCDLDSSRVVQFRYRTEIEAPLAPTRYCATRSIPLSADAVAAIDAYEKASSAAAAVRETRLRDYRSLIYAARTFEDVVEVWPAAEAHRDRVCGARTQIVALTDDVIERIKADNAKQAA